MLAQFRHISYTELGQSKSGYNARPFSGGLWPTYRADSPAEEGNTLTFLGLGALAFLTALGLAAVLGFLATLGFMAFLGAAAFFAGAGAAGLASAGTAGLAAAAHDTSPHHAVTAAGMRSPDLTAQRIGNVDRTLLATQTEGGDTWKRA